MRGSTHLRGGRRPMPAMSKRPSSLGARPAVQTGAPSWEAGDKSPWAVADPPSRGRPPRGRTDAPRGRRGHGEQQRRIEAPRHLEPQRQIEAQRQIERQGRSEPPWPASTPPGNTGFTSTPTDSGPSTGSLPAITGGLIRREGTFTSRITRDGSSEFPAEPARYQLFASLGCPWSQRALIACRLLGLDRVIGLTLTEPVADERGWKFSDDGDPLTGARLLSDLYLATDPSYPGPFTLPLIWDLRTRRVVSNDVAQINLMLETEFRPFHRPGAPDLYPAARRREIESLATLIFHTVNTGVYKAGLATSQESYDQAVEALFTTLDALEERLARRRFLLGDFITEADVRLYPTLVRFDT